ncbi:cyclopropane-fatty-acyl-phospholipid synthase family protein [Streptomyces flavotricini]|uniref:Cyclopropane-fatty-acyl-phospholipid synthase family protein n=1 Tax=Streptomyces flavotricini TaxID=66888 RepID=A0ABS8DZ14_9ACTN|nr:cyclopropane-fatty-acyl-phospholipid synthase family protein [Streptomyces flavotricini]MCC0093874.1 cyclopropane-fatty-acyl-phospholipid synthase family protein [Streptomyces flavotricini]
MTLSLPRSAGTGRGSEPVTDCDAQAWPDVTRPPAAPFGHAAVARALVRRAVTALPLRCRFGAEPPCGSGPSLTVHDPDAFFRRIGAHGLIGFGESYMAGEWDSDDLTGLLTVLAAHVDDLMPVPVRKLRGAWVQRRPEAQLNSRAGARENVHRHYDLSNELFALFLDETMSYSSAVFTSFPARRESLPAAQHRKIDRLLDLAGVGPGTRLLEIGTGWGELALRAAARGARVTTVTLSAEQQRLARRRIAAAGLAGRVDVELRDYRDVEGRYDAVVSVEMIEAVGRDFWPTYFAALHDAVAPGGRIALQSITMGHERMLRTARTHTWISKYVFPGGLIPSREAIEAHAAGAGLRIISDQGYGDHYAQTLSLWRERFAEQERAVAALGFDATFRRMWEFYLSYSEAGFRARYLDVRQLLLTEDTSPGARP